MRYYSEETVRRIIRDIFRENQEIHKVTDYPSIEIPDNPKPQTVDSPWHTGIPTEEGWYLITDGDNIFRYRTAVWCSHLGWIGCDINKRGFIAWRKIESCESQEIEIKE